MAILVAVAIGLVLIGVSAGLFGRRRVTERTAVTERRVSAYMQTIRRQNANAELAAMTDTELRDLLLSSARNLRLQAERRTYVLLGAGAVALLAAITASTLEGTRGFAIALVVGALAIYGLNDYLGRRMRAPLDRLGLDLERLRVE